MSKPLTIAAWSVLALVIFLVLIAIVAIIAGPPEDDPGTDAQEEATLSPPTESGPQEPGEQAEDSATIPAALTSPTTVTPTPTPTVTPAAPPSPTSTSVTADTVHCVHPETDELEALLRELQSCKPDLSPSTIETMELFLELQAFRYDPEFHLVGFGVCCRFNVWKQKVDSLGERAGLDTLGEIGIVPGELFSLGWEYFMNQGNATDQTVFMEASIRASVVRVMGLATLQLTPIPSLIVTPIETSTVTPLPTATGEPTSTPAPTPVPVPTQAPMPTSTAEAAKELEMNDFVLSDSGVKVWRTPDVHPLLRDTDTMHPSFLDKLAETYSRGKVRGLPRILSENSEDARTWHYFSPLLTDTAERSRVLGQLFAESFPSEVSSRLLDAIPSAELTFWPKLSPPPSRPHREGSSEPDLLIDLGNQGLILVEAKYLSDVSERTTYDDTRDQVIRLIDVGSWHVGRDNASDQGSGYANSYVIVLQYGDADTNSEEVVGRYLGNPEAIAKALAYRSDLTDADHRRLSKSVALVRWPDPLGR